MASLRLDVLYEGERLKVYIANSRVLGEIFPNIECDESWGNGSLQLIEMVLRPRGYRLWRAGCNFLPTHRLFYHGAEYFWCKRGAKPPADVTFMRGADKERFVDLDESYVKVSGVAKVFDLERGKWIVRRELTYAKEMEERGLWVELELREVEWLAQLGWEPTAIAAGSSGPLYKLREPFPMQHYLGLQWVKDDIQWVPKGLEAFLNREMPLWVDLAAMRLYYNEEGVYWLSDEKAERDAEFTEAALGIKQASYLATEERFGGVHIPLAVVESVAADDVLQITWDEPSNEIRIRLMDMFPQLWNRGKSKTYPVLYKHLRLKEPHFLPWGMVLVNEGQKAAELGLVQLKKTYAYEGYAYRLAFIKDGLLHIQPGAYVYPQQITNRHIPKFSLEKLRYVLPGGLYYWDIKDLIDYDQRMSTGVYHSEPILRIGTTLMRTPGRLSGNALWTKVIYRSRRGSCSQKSPYEVILWKENTWAELVQRIRNVNRTLGSHSHLETLTLKQSEVLTEAAVLSGKFQEMFELICEINQVPQVDRLLALEEVLALEKGEKSEQFSR